MARVVLNDYFDRADPTAGVTAGLTAAAEHLLAQSRAIVPIEEGTLERSGVASVDGERAAVSFDTPYAVRQHEELDYRHDAGRSAKYLERPLASGADERNALIAAAIRRALRS